MRTQVLSIIRTLAAAFVLLSASIGLASAQEKKFKVATTFTVIADIASNVAGDAAEVVSITKPGAEIHNYQPTPGDIRRTLDADLIIWNGLNLELWFERFLANLSDVPAVVVSEGVVPIDIEQGPYSGKPNPHAWMSPSDVKIYVANIEKAFSAGDPANAEIYKSNAAAYIEELDLAMQPLREALDGIPAEERWLVSSEGAFSYLARDFGLKELYIWPINADQQGTPGQVKAVIDAVRENNITVVFSESTITPDAAQQIARETGAAYGGILYVDSLSDSDGPVPTYLDLMAVTVETIVSGLTNGKTQ
ncbi:MAG: metal ABC transporter substrate-binding protein [Pseudomonadota bacterium]